MSTEPEKFSEGLTMVAATMRKTKQAGCAGFILRARDEIERLRDENHRLLQEQISALDLVSRIQQALGDNGTRMQDELIERCKTLALDWSRLNWIEIRNLAVNPQCNGGWVIEGSDGSEDPSEVELARTRKALREALDMAITEMQS